ncbi:MAG: hypothetical protein NTY48_05850 [Candidatus Diapherotrites archaeon]|nr:hypothetical protein [Candidatus Diapherotrites archaeon]
MCLANFIYESFKPEKIIKYATIQSVLFGTATFIGTVLSGYIQMLNFTISFLITPFFTVCFISFVARIAIFYALSWQIKEIRETTRIDRRKLLMEVLTLEPLRETVHDNFVLLLSATTSAIHKMSTATVNKISKVEEAAAKEIGLIESKASKEIKNAERIAYNDIYRAEKTALKRIKKASLKRK